MSQHGKHVSRSVLVLLGLPEITCGRLLALHSVGLLFSFTTPPPPPQKQLPKTRDGDGLPTPDPRHRQTKQPPSHDHTAGGVPFPRGSASLSRLSFPGVPDSLVWLLACPTCPTQREPRPHTCPSPGACSCLPMVSSDSSRDG